MTALTLNPDRLFSAEPRQRALARALYDTVKALPIVSPHGHTDPQWYADNQPFTRCVGAVHHARSLRVPHALQPGYPARGAGDSAARWRIGGRRRAGWSRHMAHLRGALPSFSRHADAHLAGSCLPRGVRHSRAASAASPRIASTTRINDCLARDEFRPRALFERFNIEVIATTESPLDPLAAPRQDPRQRVEGPRRHRLPPRPGRRSRIRRLRRQRRALRRADRRGHRHLARLPRRASQAPRVLQGHGCDVDRPRTSDRANRRSRHRRVREAFRQRARGADQRRTRPKPFARRCSPRWRA